MSTEWIENWESFGVFDEAAASAASATADDPNAMHQYPQKTSAASQARSHTLLPPECDRRSTTFGSSNFLSFSALPPPSISGPPPPVRTLDGGVQPTTTSATTTTSHVPGPGPSRHVSSPSSLSLLPPHSQLRQSAPHVTLYEALEATQKALSQLWADSTTNCHVRQGGCWADAMAADGVGSGSGAVCPLYYYALLLNASAAHSERLYRQYSRFVARFEQLVARDEEEMNILITHQQQDLISLTDIIGVATSVDGVLTATTIHRHQEETAALRMAHQKAERTLEKQLQKYWLEYTLGLAQDVLQALPLQNFQTMWRWGEYLLKPPQDTLCGLPDHTFGGLTATLAGPSPTRANAPAPSSDSSTMKSSGGSPASTGTPSLRAVEAGASSMVVSPSAGGLPWQLPCSSCGLLAYVIPYYGVPLAVFALRHASPESSSSYLHTRHPVVLNLSSTYDLALCLGKRAIHPSSSSIPTALSTTTTAGTRVGAAAGAAIATRGEDDTATPARSVRGHSTGYGESSCAGGGAMPSDWTGGSTTAAAAATARAELDDAIATLVMGSSQHQRGKPPRRQSSRSPSRPGRPHNGATTGGSLESVSQPASSSSPSSSPAASFVSVEAVAQMMRRLQDRRYEAAGVTTKHTISTPAEQELHAAFRECMVAQHLHGLCLEAYSMLLLIGSAARANQLLDSVHSPELLLPGHSYQDRWSTLVDETESEGGSGGGRPLHGQLYIRTSTRFWGAQVILLYTPAAELTEVELDRELGFMLRYVLDVAERWGVSTLSIALLGGPSPTALPVRAAAVNAGGDVDGNSGRRNGGTTAAAATDTTRSASSPTQPASSAPPPPLSAQHHSWGSAISETQAWMIALLQQLRQCLDYKRDVHHRPLYGSQAFSPQCCPPAFFHRTRNTGGAAATATTSPLLKGRNNNNNSHSQYLCSTPTADMPHDRPYLHLFLPVATAALSETTNATTAAAAVDHSNMISLDTATDLVAPKKRWTGAGGGFLQTIIGNSKPTTTNGISSIFSATGPPMSPPALAAAAAAAAQLGARKNRSPPRRGAALQAEMSAAFRYAQLTFPEATHFERFLADLYETPVSLV